MAQSQDPFATVIPFEVPGSIREFAEKGVSQARETYEKFKDVAQSSNQTIEAVYASASKGSAAAKKKKNVRVAPGDAEEEEESEEVVVSNTKKKR